MGIVTTVLIMHFSKIYQVHNWSKCRRSLKTAVFECSNFQHWIASSPHTNQDDDIPGITVFLMIVFHSSKNTFFIFTILSSLHFICSVILTVQLDWRLSQCFLYCFEVKFVLFQNAVLIVKTFFWYINIKTPCEVR